MCNVLEFVLSCFSVSDFFVLSNFSGIVPSSRRLQECAIVKKQKESKQRTSRKESSVRISISHISYSKLGNKKTYYALAAAVAWTLSEI